MLPIIILVMKCNLKCQKKKKKIFPKKKYKKIKIIKHLFICFPNKKEIIEEL